MRMNHLKPLIFIIFTYAILLFTNTPVFADTFPVGGVEVFAKSIANSQISVAHTDSAGNFSVFVKEESGAYNVFFVDENFPPTKITAKNNMIDGRIVVLTGGTIAKDPDPVPVKKVAPVKVVKKVSKPVVKKVKPKSP